MRVRLSLRQIGLMVAGAAIAATVFGAVALGSSGRFGSSPVPQGSAGPSAVTAQVSGAANAGPPERALACEIISVAEAEAVTGASGLSATHDPHGRGVDVCAWESDSAVLLVTIVEPIDDSDLRRTGTISYLVDELFVVELVVGADHVVFLAETDDVDVTAKLQQLARLVSERATVVTTLQRSGS